jgi:putative membrane protein
MGPILLAYRAAVQHSNSKWMKSYASVREHLASRARGKAASCTAYSCSYIIDWRVPAWDASCIVSMGVFRTNQRTRTMNNLRIPAIVLALAAAAAVSGCAGHRQHNAMGAGAAPAAAPGAARLAAADLAFAQTAAGNDMYEIEVSRIALTRAANPQVRSYAQMLIDHHTMSGNQLLPILRAKGVPPPAALPADKQAKVAQLSRLQGAEFDREYIRVAGVQDHQTAIALFDQASRTLADADLRAFAVKTLPVLRQHHRSAQNIAGTLAG